MAFHKQIIKYNEHEYPCIRVLIRIKNMNPPDHAIWNGAVQENELDIQNIVNNAVYLQYFDRARIQLLRSKGIDWAEWHREGFNLVLIHTDMAIKQLLKAHDKFYIKSNTKNRGD